MDVELEDQVDFDKLTLDEKKKLLQEYKHEKHLKVGTYVDAADTTQSYLMARVVQINESTQSAVVNFDGWPSKWNVNYKFSRIHPFLTRNKGYTGQRKVAIRNGAEYTLERTEYVSLPVIIISCAAPGVHQDAYRERTRRAFSL